jgi:hypothetical protein
MVGHFEEHRCAPALASIHDRERIKRPHRRLFHLDVELNADIKGGTNDSGFLGSDGAGELFHAVSLPATRPRSVARWAGAWCSWTKAVWSV